MIITLASQKGGCGKSTLATNIATTLKREGKSVVLIDADRQATTANWLRYRENEPYVPTLQLYDKPLMRGIKELKKNYEYVIIDTAGGDLTTIRYCCSVSNMLLTPCRPSQADIDTLHIIASLVDEIAVINDAIKGVVVLNMSATNYKNNELEQSIDIIKQIKNLDLSACCIYDRKVYRDALSEGKAVTELNNAKATQEIYKLLIEIDNHAHTTRTSNIVAEHC